MALLHCESLRCSWLRHTCPGWDGLVSWNDTLSRSQLARWWLDLLETVPQLLSSLLSLLHASSVRTCCYLTCRQKNLGVGVVPPDRAHRFIDKWRIFVGSRLICLGLGCVSRVTRVCRKEIGDNFTILLILTKTAHFTSTITCKFDTTLASWIELSLALALVQRGGRFRRLSKREMLRRPLVLVGTHNSLLQVFLGGHWHFHWQDFTLRCVDCLVPLIRYFDLALGLVLVASVDWALRFAHHDGLWGEWALVLRNLVIFALNEVLGNHDLLLMRLLFVFDCALVLSLLHLVELSVLGGPLSLDFIDGLLLLLIQIEVVNDVGDVGHGLSFGRLWLQWSQKFRCFRFVPGWRLLGGLLFLLILFLDPSIDKRLLLEFSFTLLGVGCSYDWRFDLRASDHLLLLSVVVRNRLSHLVLGWGRFLLLRFDSSLFGFQSILNFLRSFCLKLELMRKYLHCLLHVEIMISDEFGNTVSNLVNFCHFEKHGQVVSQHTITHIIIPGEDWQATLWLQHVAGWAVID